MMEAFGVGTEIITLGVSLFVLGFAIGPLLWAPLSELYGRQVLFFATYAGLTAFNAGMFNSPFTLPYTELHNTHTRQLFRCCWVAEYPDSGHSPVLCWRDWFKSSHQRRWCHR